MNMTNLEATSQILVLISSYSRVLVSCEGTDQNNIRKLLSFVNPNLGRDMLEPFTIDVEVIRNTAIFCRAETKAV
jgi:hypothetical protein